MERRNGLKGSITVFFSMVMVIILSLVTMTIESARLACARLYFKQAAGYSLESLFADYYVPLFKDYGLLFLDVTYGEEENVVLEKYEKYLSYNLNPNKGMLKRKSFFYAAQAVDLKTEKIIYATEAGGEIVRRQIYGYMKYRLPTDFAGSFLAELDYFEQAEVVKDFFGQLKRLEDEFKEVDEAVSKFIVCIDKIKAHQAAFCELGEQLKNKASLKEKALGEVGELIKAESKKLLSTVKEAEEISKLYRELTSSVSEYLTKLGERWLNGMELPEWVRRLIKDEIEELLTYSGGKDDIYGIEKCMESIARIKMFFEDAYEISEEDISELIKLDINVAVTV